MKIALIKKRFSFPGGQEKYAIRLINAFVKRGIDVEVLTGEKGRDARVDKRVQWTTLNFLRGNRLVNLLSFNHAVSKFLTDKSHDCVLSMERTTCQTHIRLGAGCHVSYLDRKRSRSDFLKSCFLAIDPYHKLIKRMEKKSFRAVNLKRIFCNSFLTRDEVIHSYPWILDKITVIHNGVEWEELSESFSEGITHKEEITCGLDLDPENFYYIFIGSGYERKGLEQAIAAMASLPEETHLLVVGKDKKEKWYFDYTKKIGLSHRVHFYGSRANVVPFLQIADAFVLPSWYDPFSNSSLEALAMGVFLITGRMNGCSEVLQEGSGCVIEDLHDESSVIDAMNSALAKHKSKSQVRETVKHLDYENQLKKIVDICIADALEKK